MILSVVSLIFAVNIAVFSICDGRPWIDDENAVEESGDFELQPRVIDIGFFFINYQLDFFLMIKKLPKIFLRLKRCSDVKKSINDIFNFKFLASERII